MAKTARKGTSKPDAGAAIREIASMYAKAELVPTENVLVALARLSGFSALKLRELFNDEWIKYGRNGSPFDRGPRPPREGLWRA
jgi:hypothetical protein